MHISSSDGKDKAAVPDLPSAQCDPSPSPVVRALDQRKVLSSLEYNKNLLKYLNDDRQRQLSFCDLVIVVEGKEFQVHKVVVAVGSSYFHACLTKNPNMDVVTLEHVNSSIFQHLLNFLYTSEFLVLETEISLVLEAAKFLDIIDAVKLLAAESDILPPVDNQPPLNTEDEAVNKLDSSHKCPFCERSFCYKKTLENHVDKSHKLDTTDVPKDSDSSPRKSTRKRKSPQKYDDVEDVESDSGASSSDLGKSSQESTDPEDSDSELHEESHAVEDNDQSVEEEDGEEVSGGDEGQNIGEQEEGEQKNENAVSFGKFPEGLAPIVLQINNKRTLKCPKCDKTFDRFGEYIDASLQTPLLTFVIYMYKC